jgi:hypothetical protein
MGAALTLQIERAVESWLKPAAEEEEEMLGSVTPG